jgi:hypothetical protein
VAAPAARREGERDQSDHHDRDDDDDDGHTGQIPEATGVQTALDR